MNIFICKQLTISDTVFFRLLASSKLGMQNCKVSRDLNPPIESKLSRDNLDSIGGFKSRDTLQFCIPSLDEASNLKNTVTHNILAEDLFTAHYFDVSLLLLRFFALLNVPHRARSGVLLQHTAVGLTRQTLQVGHDLCARLIDLCELNVATDPPGSEHHYPHMGTWQAEVGICMIRRIDFML